MENVEWVVGRRKKFGEESGFVNVRVPKSKVSEYRAAINKLVNEKFSRDSCELNKEKNEGNIEKKTVTFRDFREFGKEIERGEASKTGDEDDFFTKIIKEVDKRSKTGKEIKWESFASVLYLLFYFFMLKDSWIHLLCKETPSVSFADLENLCREAGMQAIREKMEDFDFVELHHFEEALTKVGSTLQKETIDKYENLAKQLAQDQKVKDSDSNLYQ